MAPPSLISNSSTALNVPLRVSLAKFSHCTVATINSPMQWTHLISRGDLQVKFDTVRELDSSEQFAHKSMLRVLHVVTELEAMHLDAISSKARAESAVSFSEPNRTTIVLVKASQRAVAIRYQTRTNKIRKIQLTFETPEGFQLCLDRLKLFQLPIIDRETGSGLSNAAPTASYPRPVEVDSQSYVSSSRSPHQSNSSQPLLASACRPPQAYHHSRHDYRVYQPSDADRQLTRSHPSVADSTMNSALPRRDIFYDTPLQPSPFLASSAMLGHPTMHYAPGIMSNPASQSPYFNSAFQHRLDTLRSTFPTPPHSASQPETIATQDIHSVRALEESNAVSNDHEQLLDDSEAPVVAESPASQKKEPPKRAPRTRKAAAARKPKPQPKKAKVDKSVQSTLDGHVSKPLASYSQMAVQTVEIAPGTSCRTSSGIRKRKIGERRASVDSQATTMDSLDRELLGERNELEHEVQPEAIEDTNEASAPSMTKKPAPRAEAPVLGERSGNRQYATTNSPSSFHGNPCLGPSPGSMQPEELLTSLDAWMQKYRPKQQPSGKEQLAMFSAESDLDRASMLDEVIRECLEDENFTTLAKEVEDALRKIVPGLAPGPEKM